MKMGDGVLKISKSELSAERCKLLHEYVNRAHLQTPREYWIYTELFMAVHGEKDYCSHEVTKLTRGK